MLTSGSHWLSPRSWLGAISALGLVSSLGCSSASEAPADSLSSAMLGAEASAAPATATASPLVTRMISHPSFGSLGEEVPIRIGEQRPVGTPKGDVLYLMGLADRIDNHAPLFSAWTSQGYRVVTFDYPGQGESGGSLNHFDFSELANLATRVIDTEYREDDARPLIIAGWSTGGLLAIRMAQVESFPKPRRRPQHMVLFAPGISVRPIVGELQLITWESLTSNVNAPGYGKPMKPMSPLEVPMFAARLFATSLLSRVGSFPKDIPTLVLLGGEDEDVYAKTSKVKEWVSKRRGDGANVVGVQCPGMKHQLDNEIAPFGDAVRRLAATFDGSSPIDAGPCELFAGAGTHTP